MIDDVRVIMPDTATSWSMFSGSRSRMSWTSRRLNGRTWTRGGAP